MRSWFSSSWSKDKSENNSVKIKVPSTLYHLLPSFLKRQGAWHSLHLLLALPLLLYFACLRILWTIGIRFICVFHLFRRQACTSSVRITPGLVYCDSPRKSLFAPHDRSCFLRPFRVAWCKLVFFCLPQLLDFIAFHDPFLQFTVSFSGLSTFIEEVSTGDTSDVDVFFVVELLPFVQGEELLWLQPCDIVRESTAFELTGDEGSAGVLSSKAAVSVSRCVELVAFRHVESFS